MPETIQMDLPKGFNPLKYVKIRSAKIMHAIQGYARTLEAASKGDYGACGLCTPDGDPVDIINTMLVLENMIDLMPTYDSMRHLRRTVTDMKTILGITLDDERMQETLRNNPDALRRSIDSMFNNYSALEKSLGSERIQETA